jgi:hypothetical protein
MDVAMMRVSPADGEGCRSLGLDCTTTTAFVRSGKFLIARVIGNVCSCRRPGRAVKEDATMRRRPGFPGAWQARRHDREDAR